MSKGKNSPPEEKRFKKDRSGNPKGRPRKAAKPVSTGSVFRRVASELVPIEIDGAQCKIERWHLYVRQIYNMALNKSSGAARLLDQLRRQFPGDVLPGDPITYIISEADAKL
jgi:hypothetical protein